MVGFVTRIFRLHYRSLCGDSTGFDGGFAGYRFHRGAGRGRHCDHWGCQYRRYAGRRRLGKRYSKKYLLSSVYAARVVISAWFILTPMTVNTVVVFSLVMGALWLATVPLTSGLVAHIYGLRYMGTLYGIVFFSHQLGSFMGVWLGGKLYDQFGGYDIVWWVGIAVGVLSAVIHLPFREAPWQDRFVSA